MATSESCCDPNDPMDCEERATCADAGTSGHTSCGTCTIHNRPRHRCGCPAPAAPRARARA